jgi:hypothetical protein
MLQAEAHDQGNQFVSGGNAMLPGMLVSLRDFSLLNGSDDPPVRCD